MHKTSRIYSWLIIFIVTASIGGRTSGAEEQTSGSDTLLLSIQEAVQMSLGHAPEMHIAESQEERAVEAVREGRSLIRPQIVAGTGIAYNNGFPLSIDGAAPSIFQVGLSQSLFSKKNKNLIREAEEEGKAGRSGRESTENELAARTALSYFRLLQSRKMTALAEERVRSAEEYLGMVQALSDSGRMRPADLGPARASISSARQQLLVAREEAGVAAMELRTYTGVADGISIEVREPVLDDAALGSDPEALYRQTVENSPEIQRAEAALRAREFHLEAEKGERLPQINLVGQYAVLSKANNYEDYFNKFERNNYLLGFSIQIPILDGFRASSRIAQSKHEVTEARYRLESVKEELKLSVQRSLSALRIARGAEASARDDVAASKESIRLDRELLDGGKISRMEFEEIRAGLFQKELAHLEAQQILFQRELELMSLTGGLSKSFQ
jgi:outer membrane protein